MEKFINNEEFTKRLKEKWEMSDETINYINSHYFSNCKRYSKEHYLLLKRSIKKHLELFELDEQLAYIKVKKFNILHPSQEVYNIILGFLLSALFIDAGKILIDDLFVKVTYLVVLLFLISISVLNLTSIRKKFEVCILSDIENELSK